MKLNLVVNQSACESEVPADQPLLDFLRDTLGLTGSKRGCGTGACGACTVLVDGKTTKSCQLLAVEAAGTDITTIEGLAAPGAALHPIQAALWAHFAVQNGFSTPGTVMAAVELLNQNPDPSADEIRLWLQGNLSRDTGYQQVVQAIQAAADQLQGRSSAAAEPQAGQAIGDATKTRKTRELLTGEAVYIADMTLPGMAHAAILQSPHGHALIKRIDTQKAQAMPGVIRVFTAKDTEAIMPIPVIWIPPYEKSNFLPHPSGIVPGSHRVFATDKVRFAGDQLAAVVAETREQAYAALAMIEVDFEALPVVLDAEKAIEDGAPQLHETAPNNRLIHTIFGDKAATQAAIDSAQVVVRQRIYNQRMMHNTLEVRGVLANYEPLTDQYTLWANTQIPYPHRLLISAYVLGIPYNNLRVIVPTMGESNGCKGNLYPDTPLVLWMAKQIGRPVKWVDTREGFSRSTAQSRDQIQYGTLAGTRDGKISALMCRAYSNVGAYPVINAPGQPLPLIGKSITGAYVIPHACYEVDVVYTNKVPTAPMRGSGRAEAIFFIERMIELFAREIGMDPAEVRRINMVQPDQFPFENGLGWVYDSGNYQNLLDQALAKAGYADLSGMKLAARQRGKWLGLASGPMSRWPALAILPRWVPKDR